MVRGQVYVPALQPRRKKANIRLRICGLEINWETEKNLLLLLEIESRIVQAVA